MASKIRFRHRPIRIGGGTVRQGLIRGLGTSLGTSGGSNPYPNEPSGLVTPYTITAVQPCPFDVMPAVYPNNGTSGLYGGVYDLDEYGMLLEEGGENFAIVNDAERGNVLQLTFKTDLHGGSGPGGGPWGGGHVFGLSGGGDGGALYSPFDVTKMFIGFYQKLSANWVDANVGTKLIFFWGNPTATKSSVYVGSTDRNTPYMRRVVIMEHDGTGGNTIYYPSSPRVRNVWVKTEMYVQLNTVGNQDGILKVWEDGVLSIDSSTVAFVDPAASASEYNINWIHLAPTYGGGPLSPPEEMYFYLDDWYLKVAA